MTCQGETRRAVVDDDGVNHPSFELMRLKPGFHTCKQACKAYMTLPQSNNSSLKYSLILCEGPGDKVQFIKCLHKHEGSELDFST